MLRNLLALAKDPGLLVAIAGNVENDESSDISCELGETDWNLIARWNIISTITSARQLACLAGIIPFLLNIFSVDSR